MAFDPDKALQEIRAINARMNSGSEEGEDDDYDLVDDETGELLYDHPADTLDLAKLVAELDSWLTNGGKLPQVWSRPARPLALVPPEAKPGWNGDSLMQRGDLAIIEDRRPVDKHETILAGFLRGNACKGCGGEDFDPGQDSHVTVCLPCGREWTFIAANADERPPGMWVVTIVRRGV